MRKNLLMIGLMTFALFGCGTWTDGQNNGAQLTATGDAGNPFVGTKMFVNPRYRSLVQSSIDREPGLADKMRKLQFVGTSYWIAELATVPKIVEYLEAARKEQNATKQRMVVSFVVYDLPERDCAASASMGEITLDNGGLTRYQREFIDPLAKIFSNYRDIKIVALLEPDSLANMATNMGIPRCVRAQDVYKQGVAYAIKKFYDVGASIYLDSAHSGWLGWDDNRRKMANVIAEVLKMAGGAYKVRGFATNIANYTPLDVTNHQGTPWLDASNPAKGELPFVNLMARDFINAGIANPRFVVDTSRNGVINSRKNWGSWCNVARAGVGERPRVNPAAYVDAYLWVKTPGESDGVADANAPRYDYSCTSQDSMLGAPQAGVWFHEMFKQLVLNATPGI